jgi:hypothetical protein
MPIANRATPSEMEGVLKDIPSEVVSIQWNMTSASSNFGQVET